MALYMKEKETLCPSCGNNLFEKKEIFMIIDGKEIPYKRVTQCIKCREFIRGEGVADYDS